MRVGYPGPFGTILHSPAHPQTCPWHLSKYNSSDLEIVEGDLEIVAEIVQAILRRAKLTWMRDAEEEGHELFHFRSFRAGEWFESVRYIRSL